MKKRDNNAHTSALKAKNAEIRRITKWIRVTDIKKDILTNLLDRAKLDEACIRYEADMALEKSKNKLREKPGYQESSFTPYKLF